MDEVLRFDSLAVHAGVHLTNAVAQLEARVAALEGSGLTGRGATAVAFTSGRAALDALARLLRPGDRVVASSESSGLAARVFATLAEFEVTVEFADLNDDTARLASDPASLVYLESPSSATLRVPDIARIARAAHDTGGLLAVDNSLLGAFACRPLEFGADVVVYSSTAALTGDAGLPLGLIVTRNDELVERLRAHRDLTGTRAPAQTAGNALRGLKTLSLRNDAQSKATAQLVARFAAHDSVRALHYPTSVDASRTEVQQLTRDGRELGGAVFALSLWSAEAATAFLERLNLFGASEWAGGTESVVCQPARSSHRALAEFDLALPETLVRVSVGVEDPRDLGAALERALDAIAEFTPPPVPVEPDEPEGAPLPLQAAPSAFMDALDNATLERFERLRAWRDDAAREQGINRLLVLSNGVLQEIALRNPDSLTGLGEVRGVGPRKLERYGEALLEVLAQEPQPWSTQLEQSHAQDFNPPPKAAKPDAGGGKKKRRRKRKPLGAGA
jgi:cystathionine beta-lyase/cystathionine gamma-synthase